MATDERRAQLIEVGLRLFSDASYDEVSIEAVAEAANVSRGLLYHYFGGKRAFYVAAVELASERLLDAIEADSEAPQLARVQGALTSYLDFVDQRAGAYSALLRGGIGSDDEVAAIIERTRATIVAEFMDHLGLPEPRPLFRVALRAWLGAVESAALDWLTHRDVERGPLTQLLLASLYVHLRVASGLDPVVDVDLDPGLAAAIPS